MTIARHDGSVFGVAVSADGAYLASSSFDKKLRITEIATGATRARIHLGSTFNHAVDISPDDQFVLSGGKSIGVFRMENGKRVASCKGHKHDINTARFSPDGSYIATGSGANWSPYDFSVRIWETHSGKVQQRVNLDSAVQSLVWLDPHQILAMTSSELVQIDVDKGTYTSMGPVSLSSESMDYCHVTKRVILAKEYRAGAILIGGEGDEGPIDLSLDLGSAESARCFTRCVTARPDGKGFAAGVTVRDYDKTPAETCYIVHWDASGKEIGRCEWHGDFLYDLAYSPDGESIYSADSNGEVKGWQVSDGAPISPSAGAEKKAALRPKKAQRKVAKKSGRPLFVYADVFGVTRIKFGKKTSVKTTIKAAAPRGIHSANGWKKQLLVDGRISMREYDDGMVMLLNMPGMGVRAKLPLPIAPVALLSGPDHEIAMVEEGLEGSADTLVISAIQDDQAVEQRRLSLAEAPGLEPLDVGPATSYEVSDPDYDATARAMLTFSDENHFAALANDVLYAGKLSLNGDQEDVLWWRCPLTIHPTSPKRLTVTGDGVSLAVLDLAASRATIHTFTPDGTHDSAEVESLCLPAWTAGQIAHQPDSGTVIIRERTTGEETRYDVSAFNEHPQEMPEPEFYGNSPVPPPPTRLPGTLCVDVDRFLWVPWHRETIVDPLAQESFPRELPVGPGPLRRGMMEIITRENESLAALQMELRLGRFGHKTKYQQCPMSLLFPRCAATFAHALACDTIGGMTNRYEMRTHGWGWGVFGREGGSRYVWNGTADVDDVVSCLGWMKTADMVPFDVSSLGSRYSDVLGIPFPNDHAKPPLSTEAERVWLAAMLETLRQHGHWEDLTPDASWAHTPITDDLIEEAIDAIPYWERAVPYDAIHHLSMIMAHHLGPKAIPFLLRIIGLPTQANWKQNRDAGEILAWLCHHYPEHKDDTVAALEALKASGAHWEHDEEQVLDAVQTGKEHFWSS